MVDAGVAGKPSAAIDAGRSIDSVATSDRRTSDTSAAYARTAHIGAAHTGTAKVASANTCAAKISSAHTCAAMSSGARFHRRRKSGRRNNEGRKDNSDAFQHDTPPALLTHSIVSSICQSKRSCVDVDQLKEEVIAPAIKFDICRYSPSSHCVAIRLWNIRSLVQADVRFGSEADMCSAQANVR
jgi:hypothetical protein